jgi:hypothetical protein
MLRISHSKTCVSPALLCEMVVDLELGIPPDEVAIAADVPLHVAPKLVMLLQQLHEHASKLWHVF